MINLAPFRIARWFDGTEVLWLVEDEAGNAVGFETKEEAEAERNRLNSKHGLDQLGI